MVDEIERILLDALLQGDDPMLDQLRMQHRSMSVSSADFTGVGYFIHYEADTKLPPVSPRNFHIDDVFFGFRDSFVTANAILFIRDGYIDFLELVVLDGDWPQQDTISEITYTNRTDEENICIQLETRDLGYVRKLWAA